MLTNNTKTRRLRREDITLKFVKILNVYENIDKRIFFTRETQNN